MDKFNLEQYKAERSCFKRHLATPIDNTRSKFEVNDRNISGYPIVWGEQNDYREIVLKGATQNSLNARGINGTKNVILVLNQHRQAEILCRPSVLQEDEYGLYFEGEVIKGVRYADEAIAQIRQGVLKQLSYGFDYIWDNNKIVFDEVNDAVILKEIVLWELSTVTFSSGDSAQLRQSFGYRGSQMAEILNKLNQEDIDDFQNLLSLSNRAATSTQEEKKEDNFTKILKLF